jgi:acetyltransferase
VDEAALRDVLLRVSALLELCPELQELDINPIKVFVGGVKAVDVRVRVEALRARAPSRRIRY